MTRASSKAARREALKKQLETMGAEPSERRVDFYASVLDRSLRWLAITSSRPLIIGVNGPQGSGKSAMCECVVGALRALEVRASTISIDDFYLTHESQRTIASAYPENPWLEHRGAPGTHDIALGVATLTQLGQQTLATRVPSYDKSAHGGRGDRRPKSEWKVIVPPTELVFVEGWMFGFRRSAAPIEDPRLVVIEERLGAYGAWTSFVDAWVLLDPSSLELIVDWRVDAEAARRKKGETALSDADARDYIERFMPLYERYLPDLREMEGEGVMRVKIGPDRLPIE